MLELHQEKEKEKHDPCCYCWKREEKEAEDEADQAIANGQKQAELGVYDNQDVAHNAALDASHYNVSARGNYPATVYTAPVVAPPSYGPSGFENAEINDNDLFLDAMTV